MLAYAAAVRTREMAIRLALGATPASVGALVVSWGVRLTGAGIVAGLALAFMASPLLGDLLYRTDPVDPRTYAAVALLFVGVALAASAVPARRLARLDPARALRRE